MPRPIVTFTTDFGLSDAYVAEMKAAVLAENPDCTLIDVTHLIPPQDVLARVMQAHRMTRTAVLRVIFRRRPLPMNANPAIPRGSIQAAYRDMGLLR